MTTPINNFQDILDALERDPALMDALRRHILSDELLQLPVAFAAFVEAQRDFNERVDTFIETQTKQTEELTRQTEELTRQTEELARQTEDLARQTGDLASWAEQQKVWTEQQTRWSTNTEARLGRLESDMSSLKGDYARSRTIQDAPGIAADMGLEYVRTLTNDDLLRMAGNSLPRDTARSFRNANLVIEATDGHETHYIAMEISFTADRREVDRALRNANLISRFTGKTALPAVASVRNDHDIQADLDAGIVYWHPLEDRTPAVS